MIIKTYGFWNAISNYFGFASLILRSAIISDRSRRFRSDPQLKSPPSNEQEIKTASQLLRNTHSPQLSRQQQQQLSKGDQTDLSGPTSRHMPPRSRFRQTLTWPPEAETAPGHFRKPSPMQNGIGSALSRAFSERFRRAPIATVKIDGPQMRGAWWTGTRAIRKPGAGAFNCARRSRVLIPLSPLMRF